VFIVGKVNLLTVGGSNSSTSVSLSLNNN